jgi:hypothetical protein
VRAREQWYSPKRLYDARSPETRGGRLAPTARLPVAWLLPLMRLTEDEILAQAGLDALVFLRLFGLGARLFSLLSVTLLPCLVPVFWFSGGTDAPTPNADAETPWATAVSLGNLPHGSRRLWAPLLGSYFATALTLHLLRGEYKHIAALRLRQLCRSEATPEAFALLCLDIPSFKPREEAPAERVGDASAAVAARALALRAAGSAADLAARAAASVAYGHSVAAPDAGAHAHAIEAELRRLHPAADVRAVLVPHLPPVQEAYRAWRDALGRAREAAKQACADEADMPLLAEQHGTAEDAAEAGLQGEPDADRAGSGALSSSSLTTPLLGSQPDAPRLLRRRSRDGGSATLPDVAALWRSRWAGAPDAADAARAAAAARAALVRAQAAAAAGPSHAAFVVFSCRRTAAAAAQVLLHPNPLHWQLRPAPAPGEVHWMNLRLRWWERRVRGSLAAVVSAFTVLFFLVPVTAISSLSALERLRRALPFIPAMEDALPLTRGLLEGYLPGAALAIALAFVPLVFQLLSHRQGCVSISDADRQVASRVFAVLLLDVFLGGTVARSIVSLLMALSSLQWDVSLADVLALLGTSVPASAPLFITFLITRALAGLPLELSRLSSMLASAVRAALQTPDVLAPGPLPYGTQVPNILLVALLGLVYAPIAPMLLPFAALFFMLGSAVWRYQVLFVYTRVYESNGAWWPHMANRLLASLAVGHATLAAVFALKLSGAVPPPGQRLSAVLLLGPAVLPLPVIVAAFARHYRRRFGAVFKCIPLSCAAEMGDSENGLAFERVYIAPCMRPPAELEAAEPQLWRLPAPYDEIARAPVAHDTGGSLASVPEHDTVPLSLDGEVQELRSGPSLAADIAA